MENTTITNNPRYNGFEDGWFMTNDDVRLHYLAKGEGKPLIFIPGWSGDSSDFMFVAPAFSETFRVYVLDMRGHGYSQAPDFGWRIARLAKDVQEFTDSLKEEKVNLIGYSMGCAVLWSYIDLFGQDKIEKLVMVDEAPFLLANPEDTDEQVELYAGNRMDAFTFRNTLMNGGSLGSLFRTCFRRGDPTVVNAAARAERDAVGKPFAREFLSELIRDHLNQDWRDVIRRIRVPSVFVNGSISHATSEAAAAWVAEQIPGCERIIFTREDQGTHELMINAPEKFVREISAFLRKGEL